VLPRTQQMVELKATLGADARWSINDVEQLPRKDGRVLWEIQPGKWIARAGSRMGTAETTFTVE